MGITGFFREAWDRVSGKHKKALLEQLDKNYDLSDRNRILKEENALLLKINSRLESKLEEIHDKAFFVDRRNHQTTNLLVAAVEFLKSLDVKDVSTKGIFICHDEARAKQVKRELYEMLDDRPEFINFRNNMTFCGWKRAMEGGLRGKYVERAFVDLKMSDYLGMNRAEAKHFSIMLAISMSFPRKNEKMIK